MNVTALKQLVEEIVKNANNLKNKHTSEKNAQVNYACIFAQSKEQYNDLLVVAKKIGSVIKETLTGPLFHIQPLNTVAGNLRLLKIRKPDTTRPELGDADFTVTNYTEFKKNYLSQKGFKLIVRENFEMIELVDPQFNVRAYFSNPPLNEQLRLWMIFQHQPLAGSNAGSNIIHSIIFMEGGNRDLTLRLLDWSMNSELVENRVSKVMEIYLNNGRSVPNPFKMSYILKLNPKRRRFGEFVNDYKRCNNGYP